MSRSKRPRPKEWAPHERAYLAATGRNMIWPFERWARTSRRLSRLAGELLEQLCECPAVDAYDVLMAAHEDLDRRRRAREISGIEPLPCPGLLPFTEWPAALPIYRDEPTLARRAVRSPQRPSTSRWKPSVGDTVIVKASGRKARVEGFTGTRVVIRFWVGGGPGKPPRPSKRSTRMHFSQLQPPLTPRST